MKGVVLTVAEKLRKRTWKGYSYNVVSENRTKTDCQLKLMAKTKVRGEREELR